MARIKVPQQGKDTSGNEGAIVLTFGDPKNPVNYPVKDGEIVVDDAHVGAVLASVPGAELVPQKAAKEK